MGVVGEFELCTGVVVRFCWRLRVQVQAMVGLAVLVVEAVAWSAGLVADDRCCIGLIAHNTPLMHSTLLWAEL